MSESNLLKFLRRWGAVSTAMLILGILIALPSGLCVGQALYDVYLNTALSRFDRNQVWFVVVFGGPVFALGLAIIYGAFRLRINPHDE